ncbi:MAG: 23S rRNA (uracil(1939)-C(5))-methyltransferase RlmD [Candidatus Acidiferrales bacterium]
MADESAAPIEVRAEKLVYGPDALAHYDNRAVFVPFLLPGELARIRPIEQKKKFIRGRIEQILEPSPERIPAPCPHFGVCGGCNYQHLEYSAQLRAKADILRETLGRIGHIRWEGPIDAKSFPQFGYRNRVQWKIRRIGGRLRIGYFEAGSQTLCPVGTCPIVSPLLERTLVRIAGLLDAGDKLKEVDEIEAFADGEDRRLLLNCSVSRLPQGGALAEALRGALPEAESLLFVEPTEGKMALDGPGHLMYTVGEHAYRVGHLSFFQVNRFALDAVVSLVCGDRHGKLALDLYAGVGLFSRPLARQFERVIAVESNPAAARDLEFNLHESGGASPTSRLSSAEVFLERWHDEPDLVVLDPPRAGVAQTALRQLRKLAPREIVYLSCDPPTMARDLALLAAEDETAAKYQIRDVNLIDIFPQTYHMEALVRLERRA